MYDKSPIIASALFDFAGQRSTDLSFLSGDLIEIVKMSENSNDWWIGKLNGKQGDFPANYVKLIDE